MRGNILVIWTITNITWSIVCPVNLAELILSLYSFLQTRDYLSTVWFSVLRTRLSHRITLWGSGKKNIRFCCLFCTNGSENSPNVSLLCPKRWQQSLLVLLIMSCFVTRVEVVVRSDPNIKYPWFEETYSVSVLWSMCRLPHNRPQMNHLRMKSRFYWKQC